MLRSVSASAPVSECLTAVEKCTLHAFNLLLQFCLQFKLLFVGKAVICLLCHVICRQGGDWFTVSGDLIG